MRGECEKSGHDSNRWCVAQEGPGWSWNSWEDGRSHLPGRCVELPEGHFPLQPSCVCLFITLVLTLAAALGGTFFWPEVITSLPSHFAEGETEGHRGALVCQWLNWDGGASWAAIYGVAQSRTRLKRLSSSSSRAGTHIWSMQEEERGREILPLLGGPLLFQGTVFLPGP